MANHTDSLDTQTVAVWLNQAAGFAKRDNFYEAAARMRFASQQVGAALAAATAPAEKAASCASDISMGVVITFHFTPSVQGGVVSEPS